MRLGRKRYGDDPEVTAYYRDVRKRYYVKNREVVRQKSKEAKRKTRYGVDKEAYARMLAEQNGKCAICDFVFDQNGRKGEKPNVDHCHKTGAVRALLCNSCNVAIGNLNDDTDLLRSAIAYLEHHAAKSKAGQ
jgi:hypothetical protein